MIEADRVLSTPPLNSSSIQDTNQDTNLPLAARAESVDSFSRQPAILASESRKRSGGYPAASS
jgi:hypothetical protein